MQDIAEGFIPDLSLDPEEEQAATGRLTTEGFIPELSLDPEAQALPDALPLSVREWTCPACGAAHDRDVNDAMNLKHLAVCVPRSRPVERKALAAVARRRRNRPRRSRRSTAALFGNEPVMRRHDGTATPGQATAR